MKSKKIMAVAAENFASIQPYQFKPKIKVDEDKDSDSWEACSNSSQDDQAQRMTIRVPEASE